MKDHEANNSTFWADVRLEHEASWYMKMGPRYADVPPQRVAHGQRSGESAQRSAAKRVSMPPSGGAHEYGIPDASEPIPSFSSWMPLGPVQPPKLCDDTFDDNHHR